MAEPAPLAYWQLPIDEAMSTVSSSFVGLSSQEAQVRVKQYGENTLTRRQKNTQWRAFISQFKNPIVLILIVATLISAFNGEFIDAMIILTIVLASTVLSFYQEYKAGNVIADLRTKVQSQTLVMRDGVSHEISSHQVVPGDIMLLSAGSLIVADGLMIEGENLLVNQSILTGESQPVLKLPGIVKEEDTLINRTNSVYTGTNVQSGHAKVLVMRTGENSEVAQIADKLRVHPPETEFERGVRQFGNLLTQSMLILTLIVFAINVSMNRPIEDALLFSVALAVGITPQLLPAIISITLTKGTHIMAQHGVVVRRLNAIENFGSMDILCTDKTGTLTEGIISLDGAVDTTGQPSDEVFRLAFLNASLQTGMANSLDDAIKANQNIDISQVSKVSEIPFDFNRERLGIIVQEDDQTSLIVKGALNSVLDICSQVAVQGVNREMDEQSLTTIQQFYQQASRQGKRIIAIAQKAVSLKENYTVAEEADMIFMGFLLLFDQPKTDVSQTIMELTEKGVNLRIITGDNKLIAIHTAKIVGLKVEGVLTGAELSQMSDEALWHKVKTTTLFAEVDPNQKERIILAFKKNRHVVGYMGDGINDIPALHAADVSLSVNNAVDIAKESADFVLLEKNLKVLSQGIDLGRMAFANTLKYIRVTISANFGNMLSMAVFSFFLPFLPLLPKQILLINFLSDFPAMMIAYDRVDQDIVDKPLRWDIHSIRNFMIVFGLISSLFDFLAFGVLISGFNVVQDVFQSSWFTLSVLTELMVLLIMRTPKPFYKSNPAPVLLYSSIVVGIFTLLLPYLPFHEYLELQAIEPTLMLALVIILGLYVIVTEITKYYFYRVKVKR